MSRQIILNLLITFLWMMLNHSWSGASFFVGYTLGLLIIFAFRRFFPEPFYLKKLWATLKLIKLLIIELFRSSFEVISHIVKPKLDISPGIFKYETDLRSEFEIMLLFLFISLTPGTMPLEISRNKRTIYIHAFHIPDEGKIAEGIKNTFEKAIMEVTR